MAYSTVADIQKDFPSTRFDATGSRVKLADIPDYIADADALIDSYLGGRYAVPVLDVASLGVLRLYSRSLVADKIKGILEIESAGSQGAYQQNVRTGLSTRDVLANLKDIREGRADLIGGGLLISTPIGAGFGAGGAAQTTRFDKDTDQW